MKNQLLHIFVSFFLLFSIDNGTLCQNHSILFNNLSGIPGNSVYDCAESNTGKLWIATDKGLAHYDGYTFKRVGLNDGLTTEFSWGFCKDSKGRIWLKNRQSPFTYIYNDSIHHVGSDKLQGINFDYLIEDNAGNMYIPSHRFNKTHQITSSGKVITIDSILVQINSRNQKIWKNDPLHENPYHKIISHNDFVVSVSMGGGDKKQFIEIWNTITNKKDTIPIVGIKRFHHLSSLDHNHLLVSGEMGIFTLNVNSKKITPYNSKYNSDYKDVVVIYKDRFGNKWLCDYTKGIWLEKATAPFIRYYDLGRVNPMYTSKTSNSITITTQKGGYVITPKVITFYTPVQLYQSQKAISNSYFLSPFKDYYLELVYGNAYLYGKNSLHVKQLSVGKWMQPPADNYTFITSAFKCHYNNDTLFALGTANGIQCIFYNKGAIKLEQFETNYIFAIAGFNSSLYSVGLGGLKKTNLKTRKTELILEDQNLVNICVSNDYLFARREDGTILKIDAKTSQIVEIIERYKDIQKIKMVDDEIWGIGEKRIVQFDPINLTIIHELNQFDGLTAPHKISIEKLGNNYYLLCEKGYYKFNFSNIKRNNVENLTNFNIANIVVNGKRSNNSKIELNGTNNFVEIHLQCIYFPFSSNNITFFYRINEGNWNESEQPIISMLNLPYGRYKLEIKAKFKGADNFFKKEIFIEIDNPAPFYQSIWFLIVLFVTACTVIAFVIINNRKRRIKQLEQQFDITQNRMKMLVMQMKPHFLSNVFNSLQVSFLEDNTIRSSQLIKDLDNYLRLSLSYSKKDVVLLYDEIALTKQYLQIEQNRLTKKIELIIAPNIQQQMRTIEVPVFILQPIIENAIWHGIQKSEHDFGIIVIDYNENKDFNIITIEDNGIGIGNSNLKGNSVALSNINERLSLIDNKKKEKYLFIDALPVGTKVSLYVTKKIKNRPH